MFVYLLHFTKPISKHHTCQHYIGFAEDLPARMQKHRSGNGARLVAVARERDIDFELVRVWRGDRTFERKLKNQKAANRMCPICSPGAHWFQDRELSAEEVAEALLPF